MNGVVKTGFRLKPIRNFAGPILAITAVQLAVGTASVVRWSLFGRSDWVAWFFNYQSPAFFVGMNALTLVLSLAAWKQFSPGQSLRSAWLLLSFAATFRLLGSVFKELLDHHVWGRPVLSTFERQAGWTAEGPLSMVVLAVALFIILRLYKRLGLLAKLTAFDHALLGVVTAYSLHVAYTIVQIQIHSHSRITIDGVLHWCGDPLICVLLFEAVFIRRAVVDMGWGLIARCWGAFVAAIFLTSVGSMGQWAVDFGYIRGAAVAITWLMWYPVAAAYALGPAYQVQAIRRVQARVGKPERSQAEECVDATTSKPA